MYRMPALHLHFNRNGAFTAGSRIRYSSTCSRFKTEIRHATLLKDGTIEIPHFCNYLLTLYMDTRHSDSVGKLFDEITQRDVRTWTILISGLSRRGHYLIALDYFRQMMAEGRVVPNAFTLSSLLNCCSSLERGWRWGKAVHCWIIRNPIGVDVALENALLDLYAKFKGFHYLKRFFELMEDRDSISWNIVMAAEISRGAVEDALRLFWRLPSKTVSSWNTMIDGLLKHGFEIKALELLHDMVKAGTAFDHVTYSTSLALTASLQNLQLGAQIHCRVLRNGIHDDSFVHTALIDMYCKCREMGKGSLIFQESKGGLGSSHDLMTETISRSALVAGYVQNGMVNDALKCFNSMIHEQQEIELFTFTSILVASSHAALLELGEQIHAHTMKSGDIQDIILSASMIDMYAKCGKLGNAWSFFRQTQSRNVVLWSVMISSYGVHGRGVEAVQLFELMRNKGIKPNEVSFLGLLTACSHAGLVKEGCNYFKMMIDMCGIHPGIEHFLCMVDLLGRAGHLKETEYFVYANGIHHLRQVWKAFLSNCWLHKNVQMTNWISEKILALEGRVIHPNPDSDSPKYVLEEAAKLCDHMLQNGVVKHPGQSWIYLKNT